ncbi:MAG: branched-chain amino acid ABC transporter permease [Ottowia sp.]|nr:branched-chain amino acid ABC transporter permease [Ottowia sp.]
MLLLALMEGLVLAAVLALAASGLSLVFGVMRVVNVAHGAFFMLGAVAAYVVAAWLGGPRWAGFLAALAMAPLAVALLAMLADILILRRIAHAPEATIVATIGLMYMIEQGTLTLFGPDARAVAAPFDFRLQLPWFGYSGYKLFVVLAAVVLLLALWWLMARSKAGLVMRATQLDPDVARAFGINVDRVYSGVFAFGAALAAIAGVLIVPIQQAHYLMGASTLLLSFIVVIIGGLGSLPGTLLAALVIGLSDGIISMFWSPTLAKIIATLLVTLVLVFRPQGLFGASRA